MIVLPNNYFDVTTYEIIKFSSGLMDVYLEADRVGPSFYKNSDDFLKQ